MGYPLSVIINLKLMDFETYWREFGKLNDEVVNNCPLDSKLEEDFKNLAKKIWNQSIHESRFSYDEGHLEGWGDCENFYIEAGTLKKEDAVGYIDPN